MASTRSIFPIREAVEHEASPTTVRLEDADEMVDALTSDTAREILQHLYTEPATASDLAAAVDTSVQNAQYHLTRLEAADVVDVVGSWYSERGTEMAVYGPRNDPLVVVAGGPVTDEAIRALDGSDSI